jgi:transcriptional regulator with XRE-family HTH domain
MKCTIKQLAEELNLSRNTVAKALKNSNEVSSKTKQLVLNKARELNYNNINKELFSESGDVTSPSNVNNGSILFLTKTYAPDSEFWAAVLTGIESILSNAHYHLVIGIMSESDLKKMDLIKDYNFVKTSVYETSYFQIFFDKKKHNRNYIKRKENKQDKLPLQLTNVEEIEVQEIKENKRIVNKDRFEKLVTAFVIESGQDENDRIQRNIASTVLRQKYIIEEEI